MSCVLNSVSRLHNLAGTWANVVEQELNLMRMYVYIPRMMPNKTKPLRLPTRTALSSTESKSHRNSRSRFPPTGMQDIRTAQDRILAELSQI